VHTTYELYSHLRTKLGMLKSMTRFRLSSDVVVSTAFWIHLIKSTVIQILLLLEQAEVPVTSVKVLPEWKI